MKIRTFAFLLTALSSMAVLNSCQKEKITPSTASSNATSASVVNFTYANQGATDGITALMSSNNQSSYKTAEGGPSFSDCVIISMDSVTKPYTEIWNFGSGCAGSDGHYRSGEIVITFNSKNNKQTAGDTIVVSYNNYVADSVHYAGQLEIISYTDGSGYLNYMVITDDTLTSNGLASPQSGSLNYQWIRGMGSSPAKNLQFSITGTMNGYDQYQNAQVATITSPLLRNFATNDCNYIIQGTLEIATSGRSTEVLNYGDGTSCSGTYTETFKGKTTTHKQ